MMGLRTATTINSRDNRGALNGTGDLFACVNIHAVLGGAPPIDFIAVANMSLGNFMFIGEGTSAGVGAFAFSGTTANGSNSSLDQRRLFTATLAPLATTTVMDGVTTFYVILAAFRTLDDDEFSAN